VPLFQYRRPTFYLKAGNKVNHRKRNEKQRAKRSEEKAARQPVEEVEEWADIQE
jgi:hypothetical protein